MMFNLKNNIKISALLFFLSISSIALAVPFTWTYVDTVAGTSSSPPFNVGEAFTISIVVDNGGITSASQIWTPADIVSITFSMNDAPNTITTVFSPVVFSTTTGSFITDTGGVLTAVPSDLIDFVSNQLPGNSTVASTNDPATPTSFFINGSNGVYHNSNNVGVSNNSAHMTNVANNIIAANWTTPPASAPIAIPTLSQWALILLSFMVLSIGLIKTRRFS